MTDQSVKPLLGYDSATLDKAFAQLEELVRDESVMLKTDEAREAFRLHWLGRKQGKLNAVSAIWLKAAPSDKKALVGQRFNKLKTDIEARLAQSEFLPLYEGLSDADQQDVQKQLAGMVERNQAKERLARKLDITLPGTLRAPGIPHPLLEAMDRVVEVFHQLGYSTQLGPQVESDFYNFEALNFPENHPARDTQDTLQIAAQAQKPSRDRLLMRTHTSPVQIRTMVAQDPPLRIVIPGKVHRNDAADATHSPIFHQVEGLAVGPDITFSDLKGTLDHAMRALFGSDVKTRFFPSFFPFTEPSADVQISCIFCGGKGCRKCKHSGWIELLGCGMVDPAVFSAVAAERTRLGLDPAPYTNVSGFAFGMGVERIAMILHGVSDIGLFYSGDLRFLAQFG